MDDAKPHIKTRKILILLLVHFSRELDSNLVNFPCPEDIKVAGCKGLMTKDIRKVLKKVGMEKPQAPMRFPTKYT